MTSMTVAHWSTSVLTMTLLSVGGEAVKGCCQSMGLLSVCRDAVNGVGHDIPMD